MDVKVKVWLEDIANAIVEIELFLPSPRLYDRFRQDLKTRRAVERNVEIIGEAMKRIISDSPNININSKRKIIDTRNRISHGYDSVSTEVMWSICIKHIPILKKEINDLLK